MPWWNPFKPNPSEDGGLGPSSFALLVATQSKTNYAKQSYEATYSGSKPVLVVCTDETVMEMSDGSKFSTGNHPIEALLPMLHFRDAGFTFDFATSSGKACQMEMWAFPEKDQNVKEFYEEYKGKMDNPKMLSDIPNLEGYSAVFIPGGHGAMINLPKSEALGRLLHEAHGQSMPTVTLCHGPATLLSTKLHAGAEFAYQGYKGMCFTDKTDAMTPMIGYLPGPMPWKCQETLEQEGLTILNKGETGAVHEDRELITGDSPYAANELGIFAAPILVKWANENKQ